MKNTLLSLFILFLLVSCKEQSTTESEQSIVVSVKTTTISQGDIQEKLSFQGKSICLKTNSIVSPISGFIANKRINYGDKIHKNQLLFEIQTKENKALENKGNTSISQTVKVLAPADGWVNELFINANGGYVLEGELLCTSLDDNDILIEGNIPFQYNAALKIGKSCNLYLADNTSFEGTIVQILPQISPESQTQRILIKPSSAMLKRHLPNKLNVDIQIVLNEHKNTLLLAKEALMTNETQSEFWVMKIQNDTLALRVDIDKGIEADGFVELISDQLKVDDMVIGAGAYALNDSTRVRIDK